MDSVFILPAMIPSVSKASSEEILIDVTIFIEHLVKEEYIVIVDSD